jgi:hypothetical protein
MSRIKLLDGVHRWIICSQCGPTIVCGFCGNNCCNAGYGDLPDGTVCTNCPDAYLIEDTKYKTLLFDKDTPRTKVQDIVEEFKKKIEAATTTIGPAWNEV